jgi:hypothetical protein
MIAEVETIRLLIERVIKKPLPQDQETLRLTVRLYYGSGVFPNDPYTGEVMSLHRFLLASNISTFHKDLLLQESTRILDYFPRGTEIGKF